MYINLFFISKLKRMGLFDFLRTKPKPSSLMTDVIKHIESKEKFYHTTFDKTFIFQHEKNLSKKEFLKILDDKGINYIIKDNGIGGEGVHYLYDIDFGNKKIRNLKFEVTFNEDEILHNQAIICNSELDESDLIKIFEHLEWYKDKWKVFNSPNISVGNKVLDNGKCRAWLWRGEYMGRMFERTLSFTFLGRR